MKKSRDPQSFNQRHNNGQHSREGKTNKQAISACEQFMLFAVHF